MPTTLREQLLVGIHQTEKQLPRITDDHIRNQLTADLDAYLEQVRAWTGSEDAPEFAALFANLGAIHLNVMRAAGK